MSDTKTERRRNPNRTIPQVDKFREAARELGTDQAEEAFDRVVKGIARQRPKEEGKEPAKD